MTPRKKFAANFKEIIKCFLAQSGLLWRVPIRDNYSQYQQVLKITYYSHGNIQATPELMGQCLYHSLW